MLDQPRRPTVDDIDVLVLREALPHTFEMFQYHGWHHVLRVQGLEVLYHVHGGHVREMGASPALRRGREI